MRDGVLVKEIGGAAAGQETVAKKDAQ